MLEIGDGDYDMCNGGADKGCEAIKQLWHNFDTTFGSLWDNFETTLGQL